MTKVLFIVDGFPIKQTYANIFVKNQAIALRDAGVDVAVLIIDIRSIRRFRRFGFHKDTSDDLPTYRVSFPWGPLFLNVGQRLSNIMGFWAYKKLIKDFGKPDILHAHFGNMGITGAKIKKKHNIPLVITEHGSTMLPGNSTFQHKQKILNEGYKRSDGLIAVGSVLSKHIKALGVEKISVIPNIVPDLFLNNIDQLIAKEKKQFISVGSLLPGKRFDLTISAFARLCDLYDDISLAIVGIGRLQPNLLKLVQDKKIEDKVSFHGFVHNTQLPDLYKNSICFVLPSQFETFGVVYLEALACGIPVIATKCGGPEDIVNNNNGLLIPIDDEEALVEAMVYMYHNSGNYNSKHLSEDIFNRFGKETVINKIIDVYSMVLKNGLTRM